MSAIVAENGRMTDSEVLEARRSKPRSSMDDTTEIRSQTLAGFVIENFDLLPLELSASVRLADAGALGEVDAQEQLLRVSGLAALGALGQLANVSNSSVRIGRMQVFARRQPDALLE